MWLIFHEKIHKKEKDILTIYVLQTFSVVRVEIFNIKMVWGIPNNVFGHASCENPLKLDALTIVITQESSESKLLLLEASVTMIT